MTTVPHLIYINLNEIFLQNIWIFFFNLQEEYAASGIAAIKEDLLDRKVKLNTEYKDGSLAYVTVFNDSNEDLGKNLIQDGLMMADKVRGRRFAKMVTSYVEAQDKAKRDHLNIWEYGDITGDEAREFGAPPPRA